MKPNNYHSLLAQFIKRGQNIPFSWGNHDCCLFACNCVVAMTGLDPGKKYRGRYSTELGAKKILKKLAGGDVETAFTNVFGAIKPRLNATNGDIVLVVTELGKTAGIICGGQVWLVGIDGLTTMPLDAIVGCWSISTMQMQGAI